MWLGWRIKKGMAAMTVDTVWEGGQGWWKWRMGEPRLHPKAEESEKDTELPWEFSIAL